MMHPLEIEARLAAIYDGYGWAIRVHNGNRFTVACDETPYRLRFGYVINGYIVPRDEFAQRYTSDHT